MEDSVLIQAGAPTEVVVLGMVSLLKQVNEACSSCTWLLNLRVYMIFNIHQEGAPEVAHIHPG